MHTYTAPTECPDPFPSMTEFAFHDALDVVAYAEIDLRIGHITWPETWHLDETGTMACAFQGSSCDTLKRWSRDPSPLYRSRREGLATTGCAGRWLIVDSRPVGLPFRPPVDNGDARAFLRLRRHLARIDVELVDAVVFDDEGHWWSLHELTSGTTAWSCQ